MRVFFARSTGQVIVCENDCVHVAEEMLSKLSSDERAKFEPLNVGGVVYFRAIEPGHLDVTTVPDGRL